MGCSCNKSGEEFIMNESNLAKLKLICQKEYNSFLDVIYRLKGLLNISQLTESISGIELKENKNTNNITPKKEFYLIPYKWFEDWEIWIKNLIIKNEYKTFDTKFKYKNFKNKSKFYFQLMTEENWKIIYKNKIYNFAENFKTKTGYICNNLIILEYVYPKEDKNGIEIFFFEKDEDLFLTNLLFSFEKSDNSTSECNNLLNLLKSSPIYEILGNMHYDQSQSEFIESKKKIIIYNKTRLISEEIKKFRKKQYELFLNSQNKKDQDEFENEKLNLNKDKSGSNIEDIGNNQKDTKYSNKNLTKNESQAISRASTIMNANNSNMISSSRNKNNNLISRLTPQRQSGDLAHELRDNDSGEYNRISDKLLLNNKLKNFSKKKKFNDSDLYNNNLNEFEITEIRENSMTESLFLSILYCFFNIAYLRKFIYKYKDTPNDDNNLYYIFSKIINYSYESICSNDNAIDINKIKNNKISSLIQNCPEYSYKKLIELIKEEIGKNPIAKIINLLHSNMNQKYKSDPSKSNNFYKNNENTKYNEFIDNILPIHDSIIFDLFFGIKKITKTCLSCNNELETYKLINVFDISMDIILKQYSKKDLNRQNTIKNEEINLSLEECLSISLKKEQKSKSLHKCYFCKKNSTCKKIKDICKYPEYTIFYFNFGGYQENLKINFNLNIILLNNKYLLTGIIAHDVNTIERKYISYCYDINIRKWIKFGEDDISEIDINKEKEDISYPIALFYQKIK